MVTVLSSRAPNQILGCVEGLGLEFLKRNRSGNHFEMTNWPEEGSAPVRSGGRSREGDPPFCHHLRQRHVTPARAEIGSSSSDPITERPTHSGAG